LATRCQWTAFRSSVNCLIEYFRLASDKISFLYTPGSLARMLGWPESYGSNRRYSPAARPCDCLNSIAAV
jgi:hypothetical protein